MKIATIYNDAEAVCMSVNWNAESGLITYKDVETEREWDSGEFAETLEKALEDTYDRYKYGWDLVFEAD